MEEKNKTTGTETEIKRTQDQIEKTKNRSPIVDKNQQNENKQETSITSFVDKIKQNDVMFLKETIDNKENGDNVDNKETEKDFLDNISKKLDTKKNNSMFKFKKNNSPEKDSIVDKNQKKQPLFSKEELLKMEAQITGNTSVLNNKDNQKIHETKPSSFQIQNPFESEELLKAPEIRKSKNEPTGPSKQVIEDLKELKKQKLQERAKKYNINVDNKDGTSDKPNRTSKTVKQYLERANTLINQYRRELDISSEGDLNSIEFVNWLFSRKPNLKSGTWRSYKQAAKTILATIPSDQAEEAIELLNVDSNEGTIPNKTKQKQLTMNRENGLPKRTSSLKEKRFPKKDFEQIITYLTYFSKSKFQKILVDWLIAGIATGLRPIEWQATDIEIKEDPDAPNGRHIWLYVINAKATNGRGNGPVRTIDISSFSEKTLGSIQRMSSRGFEWLTQGIYDSQQSQVSQLLYSTCDNLFKGKNKIYSLYSLRHQFVSNAKSLYTPEIVSALVGHIVTDTAMEHYGKRRSAWAPEDIIDKAQPMPEEVSTVKQRHKFMDERRQKLEAAGLSKKFSNDM